MKGKKSFTAYCDWIETFEALDDEQAGKLIKHLLRYVNDQNPEPENPLIKAVFASIKATLKRDLKKWLDTIDERSKSGILGNLKRYHLDLYKKVHSEELTLEEAQNLAQGRKASHSDTKLAVRDSVSVSVSVSDKEVDKESKKKGRFAPPSLLEVQNEIKQKNYPINAESFIAFYESKGWMVGKNKMKSWKAALVTWNKRMESQKPAPTKSIYYD